LLTQEEVNMNKGDTEKTVVEPQPAVANTAKKKASRKSTKKRPKRTKTNKQVSSDDLPRKTLEDALKIARAIKDNYGRQATWEDIAKAMELSSTNPNNKYYLWSASAYGIVKKVEAGSYAISETGRKILAPTYEGEDREGIVKAIANPSILARFYSDYASSLLPTGDIFANVLEQRYSIPSNRVDEARSLIIENARYAKLLEEQPDGKVMLRSTSTAIGVGFDDAGQVGEPAVGADAHANDSAADVDFSKCCFVITPIGEEGSSDRKHADAMLKHLIMPVLEDVGITAVRADKISKPGHITKQVVEHIAYARLCITDLSFGNANAHYELGIRHALKLPSVQIIRKGDKIPFDIQQARTIIIDTSDPYTIMDRVASAKAELVEHVKALMSGSAKNEESPITMYLPGLSIRLG
jgi:hypothetical protein